MTRWSDSYVVDPLAQSEAEPSTEAHTALFGEAVHRLRQDLGIGQLPLAEHRALVQATEYMKDLDSLAPSALRSLAHLLSSLAPSPRQGASVKESVLRVLASKTETALDLKGLRTLDVAAFETGARTLDGAARAWAQGSTGRRDSADADVLAEGLDGDSAWSGSVARAAAQAVRDWPAETARALWSWWAARPNTVEAHVGVGARRP